MAGKAAVGLKFLPTPSARRATEVGLTQGYSPRISTHALREEGDVTGCIVNLWLG